MTVENFKLTLDISLRLLDMIIKGYTLWLLIRNARSQLPAATACRQMGMRCPARGEERETAMQPEGLDSGKGDGN
jgi:hypothetical protein